MWKIATTSMSVFRNLDCLSLVVCSNIQLYWNFRLCCFYFFPNSALRNRGGCGLSMDAAYTRTFMVYKLKCFIEISPIEKKAFSTHYDDFICVWDGWSASDMSLTLFSTMNEWHEKNKIDFLLLLKFCIINKLIHCCLEIWNFSACPFFMPFSQWSHQKSVKITLSSVSDACFNVGVLAKIIAWS